MCMCRPSAKHNIQFNMPTHVHRDTINCTNSLDHKEVTPTSVQALTDTQHSDQWGLEAHQNQQINIQRVLRGNGEEGRKKQDKITGMSLIGKEMEGL